MKYLLLFLFSFTAAQAQGVRIVRLSQVKGGVILNRTGDLFEPAFANLPIVAGEILATRDGLAEVEFEDNSSLRLTPESEVEFLKLARTPAGVPSTAINLTRGTLYLSLASSKTPQDLILHVGNETVTLAPATHLRIDVSAATAKLVVYQGEATIASADSSLTVTKKKAAAFVTTAENALVPVKAGDAAPFDDWDKDAADYHKLRANAAFAGTPYSFGTSDLNYYGTFSDFGGCGTMWRPYLASAAWDPYGNGAWAWYPGAGYSWVSAYPWGWTPFHSGSWDFCPGRGWGWRNTGGWNGIGNHPPHRPVNGTGLFPDCPRPPRPPAPGHPTLTAVNVHPVQPSRAASESSFVFRNDSAGIGVPRGAFNLGRIQNTVATHGIATRGISETQLQRGAVSLPASVQSAYSRAGAGVAMHAAGGNGGGGTRSSYSGGSAAHGSSSGGASGGGGSHASSGGGGASASAGAGHK